MRLFSGFKWKPTTVDESGFNIMQTQVYFKLCEALRTQSGFFLITCLGEENQPD